MAHSHAHHQHVHGTGAVLWWSVVVTMAFVVLETGMAFRSRSLALFSDAGHNFTDALALLLALLAHYVQNRPADEQKTYGYQRAGVLAAFLNALSLVLLSVYLLYESVQRLRAPEPVAEGTMMWVSALGLLVNGGIMWALHRGGTQDLNIRAAFLHMLGDALGSVAIIIGAVLIRYTGWLQIDPILSILLSGLIIWTAWDITRDTLNILLEGLPRGLSLAEVSGAIQSVAGVNNVHDLHVWSLGSDTAALSCHVAIDDMPLSASDRILQDINCVLADRFHIHHTTLQIEHRQFCDRQNGCAMTQAHRH